MNLNVSDYTNSNSSTQKTWSYSYNIPMMMQEYYSKPIISFDYSSSDYIYIDPNYSSSQIALDDFKQMFKWSTAVNFCNDIEFYRTFYKDDMEFENNLWNIIYEYLYDNYNYITVRDIPLKDIDAIINDCIDIFNDYYLNGTYYGDNDYIMSLIRSWYL